MKAAAVPVAVAARQHVEAQERLAKAATAKPRAAAAKVAPAKVAVAKVAAAKAAPAKATPAKARPRRAARPATRSPARRRSRFLRPVPVIAVAMALLSTAVGFAAGHHGGAQPPSRPAATQPTVATARADYLRNVDGVLERLSARRASARARLAAARRPAAQAAQATALAGAYGAARRALPASGDAGLAARLRAAEGAYRGMAAAARRHDRRAFRAARRQVVRAEGDLVRTVDRLDES
jgi:hypothetical protein